MATAQTKATGHRCAAMTCQQLLGFEAVVINSKRLIKKGMHLLMTYLWGQMRRSTIPKHVAVIAAIWRHFTITLKPEVPSLKCQFWWKERPLRIYSLINSSLTFVTFLRSSPKGVDDLWYHTGEISVYISTSSQLDPLHPLTGLPSPKAGSQIL